MTILLRQKPLPQVVRQIVQRDNGAWFDPSDLSTLYQDAAGTIPVTAVEQPVGLMLDKSRGVMLGPELIMNGTFNSDISGWSGTSGISWSSGKLLSQKRGGTTKNITQAFTFEAGKTYKISFEITRVVGAGYSLWINGSNLASFNIDGVVTYFYRASVNVTTGIVLGSMNISTDADTLFDNISVRELYGYHATQSITASRPTLSARYNLLTKTEDFSDAVWLKTAGTIVNSAVSNPINAAQVSKFIPDTTTGIHRVSQAWNPILGVKYTQQVLLKSAGVRYVYINVDSNLGAKLCVDLQTGQFTIGGLSPELASVVSVGDGWYLCTITGTGTSQTGNSTWFQANESLSSFDDFSYVGSGSNGFYLIAADLRVGTVVNKYQRVNTATDYDTDERYFKKYLRFDGVDDYLNLPYMGLYAAGACSIVVAMSENKVAYGTTLINETNSTLTEPMYNPTRQSDIGNNWRSLIRNDANVVTLSSTGALINADGHISVRSRIERESNTAAFENSINKEIYNYTRTGTLTLDKTTIGALFLGGVMTAPNNMNLYGLIITKSALTDSQRIACERYLGRKSGVQL